MKILLVGPGTIEIPSKGWGAVETVIWQLKINLEKLGHKVDILNKRGIKNALLANPKSYDIVHLEYDNLAGIWIILSKILGFKLVITSHYGYSAWPKKWHRSYWPVFIKLLCSPAMIVLSEEIKNVFIKFHYKGLIEVLPNGTEINEISFSKFSEKDLICLGKIEPRKKQTILSKSFSKQQDVIIDFVGPIADNDFFTNNTSTRYLGTWTREQVRKNLTKYSGLILLSDGEAHALVVGEALAAGLSLIITKEAAANINTQSPFVKIVKNEQEAVLIAKKVCKENNLYREDIRNYAKNNFDWINIASRYIKIIESIISK
jgi:glycosyltransferase involved in cell wall biosynthesis